MRSVGPEAQERLEQMKRAARGPRLRHVRGEVLDGKGSGAALDPRVELGQPMTREAAGGLGNVARDTRRFRGKPVALEAERDDAVVMRPHGSALIGQRIVRGVA